MPPPQNYEPTASISHYFFGFPKLLNFVLVFQFKSCARSNSNQEILFSFGTMAHQKHSMELLCFFFCSVLSENYRNFLI